MSKSGIHVNFTEQQKIEICEKYKTGNYGLVKLAEEYDVKYPTISYWLKKLGIKKRTRSPIAYLLNEHYFDKIDTEDKAYFLGLLYADGCNCDKNGWINLTLQENDVDILNKFKNAVQSSGPLKFLNQVNKHPTWKNTYSINLYSKYMSRSLINLGCVPAKSLILKFPTEEQVPSYLLNHFLRGMWDGDGSISVKTNSCHVKLVSTLDVCFHAQQLLENELDLKFYIYRPKSSIERGTTTRNLGCSGNKKNIKFLEWLYKDATLYLERKYQKYLEILKFKEVKL